jgi:SAM-dependent methyltransferase
VFRRPGGTAFRDGWDEIGAELEDAVSGPDYASLARCTQYAHFTPEFIVRSMWSGLRRLGWRGGRVLEPGIGTGLFPALMPAELRDRAHVTGVEIDPVTARIARCCSHGRGSSMPTSREPTYRSASTSPSATRPSRIAPSARTAPIARWAALHDYFIARSIDLLKPGGLAAFVTSAGTMDKADCSAREHIAKSADLVAAIRLPEGSFRADAGTDVVVDILFFRKRNPGEAEGDVTWLDTDEVRLADGDEIAIRVNRWFARHPDFVLGTMPARRARSERPTPACRVAASISRRRCPMRSPCFRKPSMTASPRQSTATATTSTGQGSRFPTLPRSVRAATSSRRIRR